MLAINKWHKDNLIVYERGVVGLVQGPLSSPSYKVAVATLVAEVFNVL